MWGDRDIMTNHPVFPEEIIDRVQAELEALGFEFDDDYDKSLNEIDSALEHVAILPDPFPSIAMRNHIVNYLVKVYGTYPTRAKYYANDILNIVSNNMGVNF